MSSSSAIPDLWPEDIAHISTTPPLVVLQEQAQKLAQKTGKLVCAAVDSTAERSQSFIHTFSLIAPALGNYTCRMFRVKHGVHFYPLEILTDIDVPNFRAASQDDFIRALAEIFASAPVKKVVQSLMAQSRATQLNR